MLTGLQWGSPRIDFRWSMLSRLERCPARIDFRQRRSWSMTRREASESVDNLLVGDCGNNAQAWSGTY
jgi:hypothetical protein